MYIEVGLVVFTSQYAEKKTQNIKSCVLKHLIWEIKYLFLSPQSLCLCLLGTNIANLYRKISIILQVNGLYYFIEFIGLVK